MYKKAGIIVGVVVIVITLIIVLIASAPKKPKTTPQPAQTQSNASAVSNNSTSNNSADRLGSMLIISDLPVPSVTKEVGVVQQKNVVLLDGELYYVVTLLVGVDNLQLNYIVSKNGYDAVNAGDKCNVSLAKYQTTNNSIFYLVQGLDLI